MLELAAVGKSLKGQLLVCGEAGCCTYLPLAGKDPTVMFVLTGRAGNNTRLPFRSTLKQVLVLFYQKVLPSSCAGIAWKCVSCKVARKSTGSLRC